MSNKTLSVTQMMEQDAHPSSWDHFIGQPKAKQQLKIFAAQARNTGGFFGHTLLYSPEPGIGKTSLALLVAKELGRKAIILNSQMSQAKFRFQLLELSDGDIVVWDEAQQQFLKNKRSSWEWMLNYMQHGILADGKGRVSSNVPRVSFIMATTDKGLIADTVLERFQSVIELQSYTPDEQVLIAAGMAARIMDGLALPDIPTCAAIARAANGKPRIMKRLFKHLAAQAQAEVVVPALNDDGSYTYDLDLVLEWEGITEDGLSPMAQKFLLYIFDNENEPVGFDRIVDHLREDKVAVTAVQRLLLDKGYIEITTDGKPGRALTEDGLLRTRDLKQMGEN